MAFPINDRLTDMCNFITIASIKLNIKLFKSYIAIFFIRNFQDHTTCQRLHSTPQQTIKIQLSP